MKECTLDKDELISRDTLMNMRNSIRLVHLCLFDFEWNEKLLFLMENTLPEKTNIETASPVSYLALVFSVAFIFELILGHNLSPSGQK